MLELYEPVCTMHREESLFRSVTHTKLSVFACASASSGMNHEQGRTYEELPGWCNGYPDTGFDRRTLRRPQFDYAIGRSLVETLQAGGLEHVLVTDGKSATGSMKSFDIDKYLNDVNTAVASGGHIGLFMSSKALTECWSDVARWIRSGSRSQYGYDLYVVFASTSNGLCALAHSLDGGVRVVSFQAVMRRNQVPPELIQASRLLIRSRSGDGLICRR